MDWSPGYLYSDLISDQDELDRFVNDVYHRNTILVLDGYSSIHDSLITMVKKLPEHAGLIFAYTEHWAKTIGGEIESSLDVLKDVKSSRLNQVWAMETMDIPMARGFVCLVAVIDWFTRQVLSWRGSITLETDFCIEAVEEVLSRHGERDILTPIEVHILLLSPSPSCPKDA